MWADWATSKISLTIGRTVRRMRITVDLIGGELPGIHKVDDLVISGNAWT